MVKVSLEVCSEGGAFKVLVRARSIRRAEELASARFPGGVVCVVFPIDGREFFSAAEDVEGIEAVLPEAAVG